MFVNHSMAWTAEPPVASIGSRIRTRLPERRKLAIIASRYGGLLITLQTDITQHLRRAANR